MGTRALGSFIVELSWYLFLVFVIVWFVCVFSLCLTSPSQNWHRATSTMNGGASGRPWEFFVLGYSSPGFWVFDQMNESLLFVSSVAAESV
jgi:hypothetical protein